MSLVRRGKKGILHGAIYVGAGKYAWRSLKTSNPKQAQIAYGKLLEELTGRTQPRSAGLAGIRWRELVDLYIAGQSQKSDATLGLDRSRLRVFEAAMKISSSLQLTPDLLIRYRKLREKNGKKYYTINGSLTTLKHLAKWAQKQGHVNHAFDFSVVKPFKIDRRKNRHVFERAQIHAIERAIEAAPVVTENLGIRKDRFSFSSEHQRRLIRAAAGIARYCGFRPGEALAARWLNFNMVTGIAKVLIVRGWAPKDREERELPIFSELKKILTEWKGYLEEKGLYDPDGHILVLENGRRPQVQYISKVFSRILSSLKIKGRLYTLRHSYGTYMLDVVDVGTLQEYMGHESLETTQIYVHARREKLKELAGQKAPL